MLKYFHNLSKYDNIMCHLNIYCFTDFKLIKLSDLHSKDFDLQSIKSKYMSTKLYIYIICWRSVLNCVIASAKRLQRNNSKHEHKRKGREHSQNIPIYKILKLLPTLIRVLAEFCKWMHILKVAYSGYFRGVWENQCKRRNVWKLLITATS